MEYIPAQCDRGPRTKEYISNSARAPEMGAATQTPLMSGRVPTDHTIFSSAEPRTRYFPFPGPLHTDGLAHSLQLGMTGLPY